MQEAYTYIKRLLAFALCALVFMGSEAYLVVYIRIPVLLLVFSVLHARITGEKPLHLFAFYRTEEFFKKGGLRDLIRIFVTLFGFLYDLIIWTTWGIYQVFVLAVDLLYFVKLLFFGLIRALLWVLRQYTPFIVFLYRITIHYLVRWSWWLYQLSYFNIRYAFNRNSYRIALRGTFMASGIIFLFHYIEIILATLPGIASIGYIIALLPLTWSFGEIAMVRVQKMENETFAKTKLRFQNGIEAVRSILFYITLFVVLLLVQLALNLLGWLPSSGIVLGSLVFTVNSLISLTLIAIALLIVPGVLILPSHRLYTEFSEIRLKDSIHLLRTLARKILQYSFVALPNVLFSVLVLVLPLIILVMAAMLTFNLKNGIADIKIKQLKIEQAGAPDAIAAYAIGKRTEQLESLKRFPLLLGQELEHMKNLETEVAFAREDFRSATEEALGNMEGYKKRIGTLQAEIVEKENQNVPEAWINSLQQQKTDLQKEMKAYQISVNQSQAQMQIDIQYLEQKRKQIPLLFFFGGLWLVLFGSLALAFAVSFLGHVFHQVYIFRNDSSSSEWMRVVAQLREQDSRQPLLSATLFVFTVLLAWFVWQNMHRLNMLQGILG